MKVLVGYATAKGSTRGIAERIAAAFERAGRRVSGGRFSFRRVRRTGRPS